MSKTFPSQDKQEILITTTTTLSLSLSPLLPILIRYNPDITTTSPSRFAFASIQSHSYHTTRETHRLTTPFSISATTSHCHLWHRPYHHSPPTNSKHSFASHPSRWHQRYHQHCSTSCLRSDSITTVTTDTDTGSSSQQLPLHGHPRNHILTNGLQGLKLEPLGPLGRARRYCRLLPLPRICLLVSPFPDFPGTM